MKIKPSGGPVKVSYGVCSIFVSGIDMVCPLCKVLVKSGEHHLCYHPEIEAPKSGRRKPRK